MCEREPERIQVRMPVRSRLRSEDREKKTNEYERVTTGRVRRKV